MDLDRPRRVNGLSRPLTTAQVSTWVFLPTLILEFLFFCSPLLSVVYSVPLTLVFVGLASSSAYFGYLTMNVDPKDPNVGAAHDIYRNSDPNEETKFCWLCDCRVHIQSMHCKYCNKCVSHFDHHCMWLNTCIGKANYKTFYRTMVSITTMLLVHGGVQTALIVDIFVGYAGAKQRTNDWFGVDATIPIVVILSIFLLFDLGAFSLMSQLLVFHMKLQKQGLTTYAFILEDKKRQREKMEVDKEIEARRTLEMEKAIQDGRSCYHARLRSAGWLSKRHEVHVPWDPLRRKLNDEKQKEISPPPTATEDNVDVDSESNQGQLHSLASPVKREILRTATDMESFEAIRTVSVLPKH